MTSTISHLLVCFHCFLNFIYRSLNLKHGEVFRIRRETQLCTSWLFVSSLAVHQNSGDSALLPRMWSGSHATGTSLLRFAQEQRLRQPIQPFYQHPSCFILDRSLYPEIHFSLLLMRTCYVCRQYSSGSKLVPAAALYCLHA